MAIKGTRVDSGVPRVSVMTIICLIIILHQAHMYQMIYTRRTGLQLSIMAVSDAVSACGMSMLGEPHGDRLP